MRVKETGEMLLNHAAGYAADYSALFTSRSLVDKGWVESRNYLTGNQSIALSGDVTGSGATSIAATVNWNNGYPAFDSRYLSLSGGTLTGPLTLAADPANALEAATKQYVDNQVAGIALSSQFWASGSGYKSTLNNLGGNNTASGQFSLVGSGYNNMNSSDYGVILGGSGNSTSSGPCNFIGTGTGNSMYNAYFSFIAAGTSNRVNGQYGVILSGMNNYTQAGHGFIATGIDNYIDPQNEFGVILSGDDNRIENFTWPPAFVHVNKYNFISTGNDNIISQGAHHSSILGGDHCVLEDYAAYSSIIGGENCTIQAALSHAAIIGGNHNTIAAGVDGAVILGGQNITATQSHTVYMPNAAITSLAGSGDRPIMVDASGNLKTAPPQIPQAGTDPWMLGGNDLINDPTAFIGTTSPHDLVFKTNSANAPDGGERMRITATGLHAGNVGIGTSAPEKKLHIVTKHNSCLSCGPGTHEGIRLEEQTTYTDVNSTVTSVWDLQPLGTGFAIKRPGEDPKMFISGSGNIGIGSANPTEKLEVAHNDNIGGMALNRLSSSTSHSEIRFNQNGTEKWAIGNDIQSNGTQDFFIWDHAATAARFLVDPNGKVFIGTFTYPCTSCAPSSIYKLYVEGGISTRDVKVTANAFPDYVFANDYELISIQDLDNFIKTNKHLPGIPSAKEIQKNEGFEVGDMQTKLLEKLEEQSLYIISLQKQLDRLNVKVEQLSNK